MLKLFLRHTNAAIISTLKIDKVFEIPNHTCSYDLMSVTTMFFSAFLSLTRVASSSG